MLFNNASSTFVLPFETAFESNAGGYRQWMQRNGQQLGFTLSVIYIASLLIGTRFMRNRPPFDLRRVLTAWSSLLAIFSVVGFWRVYPEFVSTLTDRGIQHSICKADRYFDGVSGTWAWLFVLSKAVELGDTAFIVLRKQPLKLIHWYHHISVLLYTWHAYAEHVAAGRWFAIMNYAVHSCMYSYYTCRASRAFKIPRWIPLSITAMQLAQMVLGCAINLSVFAAKLRGEACEQSYENLYFALVVYSSYFALFAQFFYDSYLRPKEKIADGKRKLSGDARSDMKLDVPLYGLVGLRLRCEFNK